MNKKTKKVLIDGNWYYLDISFKMIRGNTDKLLCVRIDSSCYAFDEHGKIYCGCITPDG